MQESAGRYRRQQGGIGGRREVLGEAGRYRGQRGGIGAAERYRMKQGGKG